MTRLQTPPLFANFAAFWDNLGRIPPERILMRPPPGTATEADLLQRVEGDGPLCELIDGTLVEKPVGMKESMIAAILLRHLGNHVSPRGLGHVSAPDGPLRLMPGQVRIPDVGFFAADRFPDGCFPDEPIPDLYPDLAVEILSPSNTAAEMERKLREYFFAGTRLVWLIDPETRSVKVFTAPDEFIELDESQSLDGGAVLPGFTLPLSDLFARLRRKP